MTVLWEQCTGFKDKWAGIPVSFTACCSIKDENGKYSLGLKFSNYLNKDYELASRCYDYSFGVAGVTVKPKACVEGLVITDSSISGKVVVTVKLCASVLGCTSSKRVGEYGFDIRFLSAETARTIGVPIPVVIAEGLVAVDASDYEPTITPEW
jgi:hypothetical protein